MAEVQASGGPEHSGRPEPCGWLTCEQVRRLEAVLTEVVPVHGRGNFPTLAVSLRQVVGRVRAGLRQRGVAVRDVRLNGSTASHVLVEDEEWGCRDLDLVFHLDLPPEAGLQHQEAGFQHPGVWSQHREVGPQHYGAESQLQEVGFQAQRAGFELAREAVLDTLRGFLPCGVSLAKITALTLTEAYVQKLVKVSTETDRWSLVSLCNNAGRNVELKFVERIRRQFEFSVDSFQIVLDPLLEAPPAWGGPRPAIAVESVYGDLAEALAHLRERLIATRRPEEIRGGGLLKFCSLVTRGFRPADPAGLRSLQRYMTSRFFIDFPSLRAQRRHLEAYLRSHLPGAGPEHHAYLSVLRDVVDQSTVCLMGRERRQTLRLISLMVLRAQAEHRGLPDASSVTCYYQPAGYASYAPHPASYVPHPALCPYSCVPAPPAWQPCS